MDLVTPSVFKDKRRADWGLNNTIGMDTGIMGLTLAGQKSSDKEMMIRSNEWRQRRVRQKIMNFYKTAVYPQQLTVPRQYATTQEGTIIFKIVEGREINGIKEDGVRVVVQENKQQARFIMSPLFSNRHDALQWAKQHTGAEL